MKQIEQRPLTIVSFRVIIFVIKTFRDKETERVFLGRFSRKLPQSIQRVAERKLILLHQSKTLNDLRVPPSNRLEALKRDRKGQHSIRINDQWRICFVWREYGVYDAELSIITEVSS